MTNENQYKLNDVCVVIPSYNEGLQLVSTVLEVCTKFLNVVVVDDGSTNLIDISKLPSNVQVIHHVVNLGQGAALQTGIQYAINVKGIEYVLTFDADGQHSLESAVEMCNLIREKDLDIVLGSRFVDERTIVPKNKKLILKLGIMFTRFNTGLKLTDTHNGLRVMNKKFAQSLDLKHNGMAHASEILLHIKNSKATWIEHPAEIYYTEYARKKGQSTWNAINIITELMHK